MEPSTATLIVGLGGITATLISSALGLYFTSRARSATLRDKLYSKQIDLIVRLIATVGRIRVFATLLAGDDPTYKERARDDIGERVRELSELSEEGAAVLPTELWIEVSGLSSHAAAMLVEYDDKHHLDKAFLVTLSARATKVAVVARSVLGVDELTEESIRLFSSKKDFERAASLEIEHLEAMAREKNA